MAISLRETGAYVSGTANLTPVIPASQLTGDLMLCFYGTKPYSDAPTINESWTYLDSVADGTVAAGVDVGSMQTRLFYKVAVSDTETNPLISNSTNNVSGAVIIVFQKEASDTWETPIGSGGGDATAGTDFSVTAATDRGHVTGDMVAAAAAFRSESAVPTSVNAITITGCSLGSYVKSPATDLSTTSGGDMGMTTGYLPVSSGTSSAAPVYSCTLSGSHTGSAYLVRLRVTGPTAVSDTIQAAWHVRQAVSDTAQSSYHVRALASDTVQGAWHVRAAISDTIQTAWHVLAAIGKTSQHDWNVRGLATKTIEAVWNVREIVSDTLQTAWNVLAGTPVGNTIQSAWHVLQAIGQTSESSWNVRAVVTDTLASTWNVLTTVSDTLQAGWHILASVSDTLQSAWHILTPVGKTSQHSWNVAEVLTAIWKTLATRWNVRVRLLTVTGATSRLHTITASYATGLTVTGSTARYQTITRGA